MTDPNTLNGYSERVESEIANAIMESIHPNVLLVEPVPVESESRKGAKKKDQKSTTVDLSLVDKVVKEEDNHVFEDATTTTSSVLLSEIDSNTTKFDAEADSENTTEFEKFNQIDDLQGLPEAEAFDKERANEIELPASLIVGRNDSEVEFVKDLEEIANVSRPGEEVKEIKEENEKLISGKFGNEVIDDKDATGTREIRLLVAKDDKSQTDIKAGEDFEIEADDLERKEEVEEVKLPKEPISDEPIQKLNDIGASQQDATEPNAIPDAITQEQNETHTPAKEIKLDNELFDEQAPEEDDVPLEDEDPELPKVLERARRDIQVVANSLDGFVRRTRLDLYEKSMHFSLSSRLVSEMWTKEMSVTLRMTSLAPRACLTLGLEIISFTS